MTKHLWERGISQIQSTVITPGAERAYFGVTTLYIPIVVEGGETQHVQKLHNLKLSHLQNLLTHLPQFEELHISDVTNKGLLIQRRGETKTSHFINKKPSFKCTLAFWCDYANYYREKSLF